MITWIKPNGIEIETNELPATVAYADSLKWVREDVDEDKVEPEPEPEPCADNEKPKRTRRTKEEMKAAREEADA